MRWSGIRKHDSLEPDVPSLRKKRQQPRFAEITVTIVLPWLVNFFAINLFIFAYNDMRPVVWGLLGGCLVLSMCFLVLGYGSRHGTFLSIGYLCLLSLFVGTAFGLWLDDKYLQRHWELVTASEFKDVDPTVDARMTGDAGIIHFASNTFVDDKRTLGFVDGDGIYCVAPVALPLHVNASVRYWAVGKDCCTGRSNFDCGETRDLEVLTAITQKPSKGYAAAVQQAVWLYGVNTSTTGAKFVSFVADPKAVIGGIWDEMLTTALIAMIADLCMCTVAGLAFAKILIPSLQEEEPFMQQA